MCAGQDEAPVVVWTPELGVGGYGVEALGDKGHGEQGVFAHIREDADKELIRYGRDDILGGMCWGSCRRW